MSYIPYVGEIPPGLPKGSLHLLDLSRLGDILSAAVSCAVIGYMESIAIAKSLAAKHKYEVRRFAQPFPTLPHPARRGASPRPPPPRPPCLPAPAPAPPPERTSAAWCAQQVGAGQELARTLTPTLTLIRSTRGRS